MGRATLVRSPAGRELGLGYDAAGNRDEVTLPGGGEHALAFDAADRFARYTPAGSPASLALARTQDGAVETATLPSGRTIDYTRALGRPTGQAYGGHLASFGYTGDTALPATIAWTPPGGGTGHSLAYEWDADLPTSLTATGLAVGRYDYEYDAQLLLSSVKLTSGADEHTTAITRDADGLVTGLGPYTLGRSGPGASVSTIGDGALAMTIGRDAQGELRLPRADRRRHRRVRRGAHARRRRAHHHQGRDRRRGRDDVRLRLRRRPAAAARGPRRRAGGDLHLRRRRQPDLAGRRGGRGRDARLRRPGPPRHPRRHERLRLRRRRLPGAPRDRHLHLQRPRRAARRGGRRGDRHLRLRRARPPRLAHPGRAAGPSTSTATLPTPSRSPRSAPRRAS